jgi:hypothetical protein
LLSARSRIEAAPHQNLSVSHRCEPFTGVAAIVERFYKPELDAAHNPRLATLPANFDAGVMIPLPGAN